MDFRIARLPEHDHLLDRVQAAADTLQVEHPQRIAPLIQRWTGSRQVFADV